MRTLRLEYYIEDRIIFKLEISILKKPSINIKIIEGIFKSWIQNNNIKGLEVTKEEWWDNNVGDYYLRGKKNSYCDYAISDYVRDDIQKIFSNLETLISEEENKKKSIQFYFKYNPKFIKKVQANNFIIEDDGFGDNDNEFIHDYESDYEDDYRNCTLSDDDWRDVELNAK